MSLPPGWEPAGAWSEAGGIVTVNAGDGVGAAAPAVLVGDTISPGARVFIEKLFIRVADMAAYDQLVFALRRNGAKIAPWDRISGENFTEDFVIDVNESFSSGRIEIIAANISGTSEAGASEVPLNVRCVARFKGLMLRERPPLMRA